MADTATTTTTTDTSTTNTGTTGTETKTEIPAPAGDTKTSLASETTKTETGDTKTELKDGDKKTETTPALFDPKSYKPPEGMTVDEKLLGDYSAIINDDKATPAERGEKLLNLYTSAMKQVGESHTKAWTDTNEKWVNEVKADPEIGGSKFEPTKTMISKAIDTLGPEMSKAFRQSLDITGVGNNPAFIRGMAKLAAALTEGGHVSGNPSGSGKDRTVGEIFFPNSPEMNKGS